MATPTDEKASASNFQTHSKPEFAEQPDNEFRKNVDRIFLLRGKWLYFLFWLLKRCNFMNVLAAQTVTSYL